MVVKLYISGISGNKEVKKKQQRVQMILDSKQITYEAIDITEPGKEKDKEFMQQNGKVRESLGKHPLPPQIFNDDDFCGDYEDFDLANEVDELEKFLHIETKDLENGSKVNGIEEVIDTTKPADESSKENQQVNGLSENEVESRDEELEENNTTETNELEDIYIEDASGKGLDQEEENQVVEGNAMEEESNEEVTAETEKDQDE